MIARLALVACLVLVGSPAANATTETYADYSMTEVRSGGEFWAEDNKPHDQDGWRNKWTWTPLEGTPESSVAWGDPNAWPPESSERFIQSGDWLLLDGWSDNGTYYRQRVESEGIGDGLDCTNQRPIPSDGDRQHYVPWQVPASIVCLIAEGTITEESSGTVIRFRHEQLWFPPGPCSNPYHSEQRCLKQYERWSDDNQHYDGVLREKLRRDQFIAKGKGMAFRIVQYAPTPWTANGRYYWRW
ncbi:hypothetical protein MOQ72_04535 [Saccharopolyspora sp. K220]|uniref:hypothetical protein n=1 Tax=Saccharopolyspora soli TaxID=2926618 RepID=UPI001F56A4F7|nr:hypothetical protein [Saccharopolyspora soli]MCI2416680.1 hypothetical protein [Saccharopolyspora soli]